MYKMFKKDRDMLVQGIGDFLSAHNRNNVLLHKYEEGNFHNADKVHDLRVRFCFDVLYMARGRGFISDEFMRHLYSYVTDSNIYTVLKTIIPNPKRRF